MIITRKIQILFAAQGEEFKKDKDTLYKWSNIVHHASNIVASNKYVCDHLQGMVYLTEEGKEAVSELSQKVDDIFNTSRMNTTYRMISSLYKGEIPTDILSCVNMQVSKLYNKERKKMADGDRSLRSYRSNIPIPFSANSLMRKWKYADKEYSFDLFGIPFKVVLGKDKSNNRSILERLMDGTYKAATSSIKIQNCEDETGKKTRKFFLLLCVEIPDKSYAGREDNILFAELSIDHPLLVSFPIKKEESKPIPIGNKQSYLYKRLQIQKGLDSCKASCKWNKGGRGRKRKMKSTERFKAKEHNFVDAYMHQISAALIKFAIKHDIGKLCLVDVDKKIKEAKESPFVLRNWSYYSLLTKIQYKAKMNGITVVMVDKNVL